MTTVAVQELNLSPDIIVNTEDFRLLTKLAYAGINEASTVADDLLYELDRASVVGPEQMPPNVVRMGSTVRYSATHSEERAVTLVFPAEADIELGRISVMTPIGTALIGLSTGQSITWLTRGGRKEVLTVLDVVQPADAPPGPPVAH